MKSILLFAAFLTMGWNASSQTASYSWAKCGQGKGNDNCNAVCSDANANIYSTGFFNADSIYFDQFLLYNSTPGSSDVYIVRYDPSGNTVWALAFGGTDDERGMAITTDLAGNVYVTGSFYSPTITFGTFTLTNAGTSDLFIVKLDQNGTVLWATSEGGPSVEIPFSIKVNISGHIFVGGRFSSLSFTLGTFTLTQAGSMDGFIVKYYGSGTVAWANSIGGGSNDEVYALAFDSNDNIFATGYFSQNADFNGIPLSSSGIGDIFIAKYNSNGIISWAKRFGSDGDERMKSLALDGQANVYVAGFFSSDSIGFGSSMLHNYSVAGSQNAVVAKIDSSGNALWAHSIAGRGLFNSITLRNSDVHIAGTWLDDSLHYGMTTWNNITSDDFIIATCTQTGTPVGVINQTSGGTSGEQGISIITDANNNLVLGGNFDSDPIEFSGTFMSNVGTSFDPFVVKIGSITSGIKEETVNGKLQYWPNPASSKVYISSPQLFSEIKIISLSGQLIRHIDIIPSFSAAADLEGIDPGYYMLEIRNGNDCYAGALLIQ